MWLHTRLCPVLVCQVSALGAASLDFIRFLTQILWDCVSKSGSQWEVGIVASCKRSYPGGRRPLLCAHGYNLDGTTNWQTALHKDVRKALAIQESPAFQLSKIRNIFAREYLLFLFLSVSVHHVLAVFSCFWQLDCIVVYVVIGQSSFSCGVFSPVYLERKRVAKRWYQFPLYGGEARQRKTKCLDQGPLGYSCRSPSPEQCLFNALFVCVLRVSSNSSLVCLESKLILNKTPVLLRSDCRCWMQM